MCEDHHPRFAQRILSPTEFTFYQNSRARDDCDLIWHFWAAKEAAYKAYQQSRRTPFSPAAWQVDIPKGVVQFEEWTFALRFWEDGDMLLAEATAGSWEKVSHKTSLFWTEPSPEDQSQEARQLAKSLAAEVWGGLPEDYHIIKEGKVPRLQNHKGQSLACALSLTHHGRWVAASLLVF
jgi:hypothetical protein